MSNNSRDEFLEPIKRTLAARVGHLCSNPDCKQPTSGPSESKKAVTNVGVASHITAASEGGPRYDPLLTPEKRSSVENGIWLCQKCAKAIDDDTTTYSKSLLNRWKEKAEASAREVIEGGPKATVTSIKARVLAHKAYFQGDTIQHFFIKITNLTPSTDIEVTHVWYEFNNFTIDILSIKLPRRVKPNETIETFIPVSEIPKDDKNVFQHFKVEVSTGERFTSSQNVNVRPFGYVAGL